MQIQLWHGTGRLFDQFDLDKFGTGEGGREAGFGIYTDVSPRGAVYYARYLQSPDTDAYLYNIEIELSANELLHLDSSLDGHDLHLGNLLREGFESCDYDSFPRIAYREMQTKLGLDGAAKWLLELGVKAIHSSQSKDNSPLGRTIVILDSSTIKILRRFRMVRPQTWEPIDIQQKEPVGLQSLVSSAEEAFWLGPLFGVGL